MIDVDEIEPVIQEEQQPFVHKSQEVEQPLIQFVGSQVVVEEAPVEIEVPVVEEPVAEQKEEEKALSDEDRLIMSYKQELANANI